MKAQIKAFKAILRQFCKENDITVQSVPCIDEMDGEYIGDVSYFCVDGEVYLAESISDLIEDSII